jgi:hypothetical protein
MPVGILLKYTLYVYISELNTTYLVKCITLVHRGKIHTFRRKYNILYQVKCITVVKCNLCVLSHVALYDVIGVFRHMHDVSTCGSIHWVFHNCSCYMFVIHVLYIVAVSNTYNGLMIKEHRTPNSKYGLPFLGKTR